MTRCFLTSVRLAISAAVAATVGLTASAQESPVEAPPGTPEWAFEAIPSEPLTELLSAEGQRYVQALPAVGREDMHARLEGRMTLARACESTAEPAASVVQHILAQSASTQIVIINEAHDVPRHREFTRSLLSPLRARGYDSFAAEAFPEGVGDYPDEAFGRSEGGGTYGTEPTFGKLIRTAKRLGYRLVPYEAVMPPDAGTMPMSEQVALREQGQTDNLFERIFAQDERAKVIVHVGYSHAAEVPIPSFDRTEIAWMAARLKEKTGVDPLTIDQTYCESPGEGMRMAYPVDRMPPGAFDLSIAHPRATFTQGRPDWRLTSGAKLVDLPPVPGANAARILVEARFADEPSDAIPVDRLLLWPGEMLPLVLPPGDFRITVHEEGVADAEEHSVTVEE